MNFLRPVRTLQFPALTGSSEKPIIRRSRFSRLESYVQLPLPQITTFLLLLHLAFGCCMHHTHACESDCCSTPIAQAESCPCGTHQHNQVPALSGNDLKDLAERDHDAEQHQCIGDSCTFVHSQPSPEQIGEVTADIHPLEVITADSDAGTCRSQMGGNLDQPLPIAGSSLRTHLALRVLLI